MGWWLMLNPACAIAAFLIAAFVRRDYQGYGCIAIALFHFLSDYGCFWKFYFPESDPKPRPTDAADLAATGH